MNHGKCINCFWYKEISGIKYIITQRGIVDSPGKGICGMLSTTTCEHITESNCYCPDYWNWKKEGRRYWQENKNKK